MKIGAVLDLKCAYNKVFRNVMMDLVKLELPQHLNRTIAMTLQPLKIVTRGDDTNTIAKITSGWHRAHHLTRPVSAPIWTITLILSNLQWIMREIDAVENIWKGHVCRSYKPTGPLGESNGRQTVGIQTVSRKSTNDVVSCKRPQTNYKKKR